MNNYFLMLKTEDEKNRNGAKYAKETIGYAGNCSIEGKSL